MHEHTQNKFTNVCRGHSSHEQIKKGLDKALKILDFFGRKWQLAINTDKTKIMMLNKSKYTDGPFYLNGPLEKVHACTYNYLGLKISNNGSFTVAIKELYNKALRA